MFKNCGNFRSSHSMDVAASTGLMRKILLAILLALLVASSQGSQGGIFLFLLLNRVAMRTLWLALRKKNIKTILFSITI